MPRLTITITRSTLDRLIDHAARTGTDIADIAQEALDHHLDDIAIASVWAPTDVIVGPTEGARR